MAARKKPTAKAESSPSMDTSVENVSEVEAPSIENNPLLQPVIERSYTKPNYKVVGGEIPDSVETMRMERPVIDLREDNGEGDESGNNSKGSSKGNKSEPEPSDYGQIENSAFREQTKKSQKKESLLMAKSIMDGYCMINDVVRDNWIKTNFGKYQTLALRGKFDMDAFNVELPISETENVQIGDVLREQNDMIDENFSVDDDFKEENTALLAEVLAEKGMGSTPTQRLLINFGMDISKKAILGFQMMAVRKDLLRTAQDILAQMKSPSRPVATEYIQPKPKPAPQAQAADEPISKPQKPIITPEILEPEEEPMEAGEMKIITKNLQNESIVENYVVNTERVQG